jgi:hypothetical protein
MISYKVVKLFTLGTVVFFLVLTHLRWVVGWNGFTIKPLDVFKKGGVISIGAFRRTCDKGRNGGIELQIC